jgi:hypothetical protein
MDKAAKIRWLDVSMAIVSFATGFIGVTKLSGWSQTTIVSLFGLSCILCVARALKRVLSRRRAPSYPGDAGIRLLGEEEKSLFEWDLSRRVSAVIGKSTTEGVADIDLSGSVFSAEIEGAHAALNKTAGHWYLEDVSENGSVSLEKDGLSYRLSKGEHCVLTRGDIIRISEARLLFD